MKILLFTRLENNTGGDQTLLLMVKEALLKDLPKGSEVNLVLAHDTASKERANKIKEDWEKSSEDNTYKAFVWFNDRKDMRGGANLDLNLSKKHMNPQDWRLLNDFIKGKDEEKSLDLFIIAGWSHQMRDNDAKYVSNTLEIPESARILLCAPPGKRISIDFQSALSEKYNIYCLQPGLQENEAGFPMSSNLSQPVMESEGTREEWLDHIKQVSGDFALGQGEAKGDKVIVIYCSKDGPGRGLNSSGSEFMKSIQKKLPSETTLKDYPVILVGAETNSSAYNEWEALFRIYSPKSVHVVERTKSAEVLMRGLRDAQFAMATGAYSILEAKKLGIDDCKYLCPPHMKDLGRMLDSASPDTMKDAFAKGEKALTEVSSLTVAGPDFKPTIIGPLVLPNKREHTDVHYKDDHYRDDFRRGAPRKDDFRRDDSYRDAPRRDDFRRDDSYRGAPRRDDFRRDNSYRDTPRRDDFRRDNSYRDTPRRDDFRRDDSYRDAPRRDDFRRDDSYRDAPRRDDFRRDDSYRGAPRRDDFRRDDSYRGAPRRGDPHRDDRYKTRTHEIKERLKETKRGSDDERIEDKKRKKSEESSNNNSPTSP